MATPPDLKPKPARPADRRHAHRTGGPHDYAGNPSLQDEADAPGDAIAGSNSTPISGKP